MYHTAEIRWILPGSVPPAIDRWFRRDGDDIEPERRTDRYVVVPGCDSVGIKLRGAGGDGPPRIDVKARLGDATELRLATEVVGRAAAWSKWTLALASEEAIVSGLEPPTPVLTTHKRRILRRFIVEGDRTQEIPIDEDVDGGCDIELSAIVLDGIEDPWWSLGLEAFGQAERVRDTLSSVGQGWFKVRGAPPLDPPHRLDGPASTAYPAWLLGRLVEVGHWDR